MKTVPTAHNQQDYTFWPLENLAEELVSRQHQIQSQMSLVNRRLEAVRIRYQKVHPEISVISGLFGLAESAILQSLEADRNEYLPYICTLSEGRRSHRPVAVPSFSSIAFARDLHFRSFSEACEKIDRVAEMAEVYSEFTGVGTSCRELSQSVNVLAEAIRSYRYFEFTILFRRAEELESTVGRLPSGRLTQ